MRDRCVSRWGRFGNGNKQAGGCGSRMTRKGWESPSAFVGQVENGRSGKLLRNTWAWVKRDVRTEGQSEQNKNDLGSHHTTDPSAV